MTLSGVGVFFENFLLWQSINQFYDQFNAMPLLKMLMFDWYFGWLTEILLICWLIVWLIDWLIDWLIVLESILPPCCRTTFFDERKATFFNFL